MKIFELSKKLINPIDFSCYWYLPAGFKADLQNDVLISVLSTLDRYTCSDTGYQNNIYFREMIKNSRVHGGNLEGKDTFCGLFVRSSKENDPFCFGINDGGDYFKRKDIKDIWENKRELKEFHKPNDPNTGFHLGYRFLKDSKGDLIVDNNNGTLYFLSKVKRK